MIKYDKYKPSGIDWLGNIPKVWEIKRIKDICFYVNRGTSPNYVESSDFKVINQATFSKGFLNEDNIRFTSEISNKKSYLKNKDLLIASTGGGILGKVFYFEQEEGNYIADSHVTIIRDYKEKFVPKYFYYFFSENFKLINEVLALGTTNQTELQRKYLLEFEISYPTIFEQNQIVTYLDNKTLAIDKKINALTQKSNYYKEYRKSIINDAICKGLENNVKLKDTELGFKVNISYNNYRLKDLGKLYSGLSGKAGDDFNQDDNIDNKGFIPFTNIANNTYLKKDHLGTVVVYENEKQNNVKKGDIFFLMSSEGYEDIGKSAILDEDLEETYLNSFCKGFRMINKKANPYFLNYLLLSDNYRKQLIVEGKGFTRINLKMEKVNDFIVYIPTTINEQNNIVKYIDTKTQTIDMIVDNINTQVLKLKELRKTLINDVVTGKIKVTT